MAQPGIGSAGPGGPRTGNPGAMADSMTKVQEAVKLLQMALPDLPVGSEPHKAVLKMIQDGSKIVPPTGEQQGVQSATLAGLGDRAKQMAMMQQLAAALHGGGQGGGAPAPGGPPPEAAAPPAPGM